MVNSPKFLANAFVQVGRIPHVKISHQFLRQTQMVKVPGLFDWQVLVSGRDLVEEVRKAPDDKLNMYKATEEVSSAISNNSSPIPQSGSAELSNTSYDGKSGRG
jgi:hypothetical protein